MIDYYHRRMMDIREFDQPVSAFLLVCFVVMIIRADFSCSVRVSQIIDCLHSFTGVYTVRKFDKLLDSASESLVSHSQIM